MKAYSQAWFAFLKRPLPVGVYKQILVHIREDIVPHLNQPLLLSDFLTLSYDQGGVVALLALNGLFHLIHKHNL